MEFYGLVYRKQNFGSYELYCRQSDQEKCFSQRSSIKVKGQGWFLILTNFDHGRSLKYNQFSCHPLACTYVQQLILHSRTLLIATGTYIRLYIQLFSKCTYMKLKGLIRMLNDYFWTVVQSCLSFLLLIRWPNQIHINPRCTHSTHSPLLTSLYTYTN